MAKKKQGQKQTCPRDLATSWACSRTWEPLGPSVMRTGKTHEMGQWPLLPHHEGSWRTGQFCDLPWAPQWAEREPGQEITSPMSWALPLSVGPLQSPAFLLGSHLPGSPLKSSPALPHCSLLPSLPLETSWGPGPISWEHRFPLRDPELSAPACRQLGKGYEL